MLPTCFPAFPQSRLEWPKAVLPLKTARFPQLPLCFPRASLLPPASPVLSHFLLPGNLSSTRDANFPHKTFTCTAGRVLISQYVHLLGRPASPGVQEARAASFQGCSERCLHVARTQYMLHALIQESCACCKDFPRREGRAKPSSDRGLKIQGRFRT